MAEKTYDAIVVGARCAGSPTAMLLARKGYRVLARRPGDVPERHDLDPPRPPARRRRARALGAARPARRRRGCPPIHTYAFDFGPFTISGLAGHRRTRRSRTARGGPCSTSCSSTPPSEAGAEVREDFAVEEILVEDGRVDGIRGREQGRRARHRARPRRHRRRRPALARRARPCAPSSTTRSRRCSPAYYTLLERSADGRPLRDLRPAAPRLRRGADERRPDPRRSPAGRIAEFEANKKDVEGNYLKMLDAGARRSPSACAPRSARRGSPARPCRTSSASPTAPAGRWSATPATTRTSSRRRGSPTRSATPSCARPRSTSRSPARAPSTTRWPSTSRTRDEHVAADVRVHLPARDLQPPPPELQQLFAAIVA